MKCLECPLKYIGQTDRTFHTRYKERVKAIRNNNSNSEYSNHILNTGHKYGSITDAVDIIRIYRNHLKHIGKIQHTRSVSGKLPFLIRKMLGRVILLASASSTLIFEATPGLAPRYKIYNIFLPFSLLVS
jgi:hypothetical protein